MTGRPYLLNPYHSPEITPPPAPQTWASPVPQAKLVSSRNVRLGVRGTAGLVGHRRGIRGRSLGALEGQKLLTVNRHVTRRLNTQANFAPVDVNDRDTD